jgi:hypothetical protein
MNTPMRFLRTSLCNSLLLLGLFSGRALAGSSVTVSELQKTSATEGSLLLTLNTTEPDAVAFETEFVYDPARVDVSAPGSLQVPGAEGADFTVDSFKVANGRVRVVLSSSRLRSLGDGTTFRVPVRAAKGVSEIDTFFPVAVTDMELSDLKAKGAKPKVGTSLRIKKLQSGTRLNGKSGVSLGLELIKDDAAQISKVEYLANGKVVKEASGTGELHWTPPGSGAFQLSARVTLKDGSQVESKATPVIVTGIGTAPVRGAYSGVVEDSSGNKAASSTGTVQIATSTSGAAGTYSIRLVLNGASIAAFGMFNAESIATPTVLTRVNGAAKTYRLFFQQEATGFADSIRGVVTDGTLGATGTPSGGSFAANFVADRNVWVPRVQETGAMSGRYTLALRPVGDYASPPLGVALLSLGLTGSTVGQFSFNDGTRAVAVGTVAKDGGWRPYSSLYSKKGFLVGVVDFSDKGQTGILGGELDWRKSVSSVEELDVLGGKFVAPLKGPLLTVKSGPANLSVRITGGSLSSEITQSATLSVANTVQVPVPNPHRLSLRFDRNGGGWMGSFTVSGDKSATPVSGVILQGENRAVGYFLRSGTRGFVEIAATP